MSINIKYISLLKNLIYFFIGISILTGCSKKRISPALNERENASSQRTKFNQGERIISELGKQYIIQTLPIDGFNNNIADGSAVIEIDQKYAIIQPEDSYKFSWFKQGNETDDITLQRAIDFIHYIRLDGKNVSNGKMSKEQIQSTLGTIFIDQNITLKNTVEIYENVILKGDFTASNDNNFRSNTIFIDLKNSSKPAIRFKRFPGSNMNYVSARLEGIRFSALSPCRSAVEMVGASGNVLKDVMISGNRLIENGIEISNAIFCKVSNVRVEKVKNYGVYLKKTNGSISTTTEIEHFNVNGAFHGIFVEHKSCNSLWLKNCTVEMTDNSAIKIEQYNTVHIDNLYTENVPNGTEKTGTISIIDINSTNYGETNGNKGLVTITNSIILGYYETFKNRRIAGILVDNLDLAHINGCRFYLVDNSIIMKAGCNSVNWVNNSENGNMNVYNALNHGNPKDNGIENPNAFNVISSYSSASGKYGPYTRLISQKSRLHTPILLSRGNNRLRIAEEGIDESKHFAEMWVQYGQQPGELRVAPGGKNVAATFGTNGGVTFGNDLKSSPPDDGIRVNGQGIFGQGAVQKSAALQIESNDKGFLPPRLSTIQRDAISSPVAGLIIFNITINKHQGFNGNVWNDLY